MRIAQLANFVGPTSGGIRTTLAALGEGYVAAGVARLLVVPGPEDRYLETASGDVVQLRAPRVGGGYRLLVEPWRAIEPLRRFGPTSVEVSDKSTLLPVTRWARRSGVPSVLLSHERLDAMLSLRTGLPVPTTAWNRAVLRRHDRVVVTSRYARDELRALAAATGTPLHRVPLGVDLATFHPRRGPDRSAGPLRLVHAGRLSREKSPHLAVATAVALHRRGVPVQLDVYGDGPHRSELETLAEDAPVTFHGHLAGRERLAERLARADVSLSVCPGETFGLSVLEALACGTPVVTADEGGGRELVDGACGAWAPASPDRLADAVLEVAARDMDLRRRAARRRAEEYPWSRAVEGMLEVHDLALSGAPAPAAPARWRAPAGDRRPA
ncbi:glycosyltransferase [Nocardioides deserti]|uniref:Glycosyltransferase n=1 Tax=Nocardioides deserti TaxID=1588644 RepID=A0ABR6UBT3_9ACTN|nr:glycosyltransferase [Nocardioides deserti]MBC2961892.1 glycosyltransferase [Nocardioides deserti]GGO79602.1 GDP-mannose-dependent alpha-(1-6)-phosphatidylinositol dimannoside mannosyltransferase [Nocardioides deserti]